jgi:hypothetical protein
VRSSKILVGSVLIRGVIGDVDYCYPSGIFESPKSIDNISISAKIELIHEVFELAIARSDKRRYPQYIAVFLCWLFQ